MRRPRMELVIDELVLQGYSQSEGRDIATAAEAELSRLLTDQPIQDFQKSGIEILDGISVDLSARSRPALVGAELGQALYRSVMGTTAASCAAREGDKGRVP